MKNVSAQIVKFISNKDNKEHEAVQFIVHTAYGDYKSGYCFPSSLEFDLVKRAISSANIPNNNLSDLGYEEDDNSL